MNTSRMCTTLVFSTALTFIPLQQAPSTTDGGILEDGADMVEITEQLLDVNKASAAVGDDGAGESKFKTYTLLL